MRRTLAALGGIISLLLAACDGSSDDGNFSPPPPPSPPPPTVAAPQLDVQQVFTQINLSQPLVLVQAPGEDSLWFAVERSGVVRVFANDPNATQSQVFLDISSVVDDSFNESGLLGFAFHPDFPTTPGAFVSYTRDGAPLTSYVSYFGSSDGGATLDPGSEQPLMIIPQPASNHNGGNIAFGPDGNLYIGFGDGGGAGDPGDNAQDLTNVLGALLRIDVSSLTSYTIPPDNPFANPNTCPQGFGGGPMGCPEIYAYGLRNPWRFTFDSLTGDLWLGDVGQGAWEEVDIIDSGGNYGWRCREGAHDYDTTGCGTGFIDPITEYGRNLGNSITGGYVYRGSAIPDLVGWYVFGDFGSGRLFAIPADSASFVEPEMLAETGLNFATFGQGVDDGELYVTDYGTGDIYRIVEAP